VFRDGIGGDPPVPRIGLVPPVGIDTNGLPPAAVGKPPNSDEKPALPFPNAPNPASSNPPSAVASNSLMSIGTCVAHATMPRIEERTSASETRIGSPVLLRRSLEVAHVGRPDHVR
jgi:hypothetical protein